MSDISVTPIATLMLGGVLWDKVKTVKTMFSGGTYRKQSDDIITDLWKKKFDEAIEDLNPGPIHDEDSER